MYDNIQKSILIYTYKWIYCLFGMFHFFHFLFLFFRGVIFFFCAIGHVYVKRYTCEEAGNAYMHVSRSTCNISHCLEHLFMLTHQSIFRCCFALFLFWFCFFSSLSLLLVSFAVIIHTLHNVYVQHTCMRNIQINRSSMCVWITCVFHRLSIKIDSHGNYVW